MASISTRTRADGTTAWRVQYRITGSTKPTSDTFDDPDEAIRFAALVDRLGGDAARRIRESSATPDGRTLSIVLEDYLDAALDITAGTKAEYRRVLARSGLADRFASMPVDLISQEDVEAWVKDRAATISEKTHRPISAKTIRNEHGLLSTILEHAVTRQWRAGNPARGVRLPKRAHADLEIPSVEEFLRLHDAMTEHYRPLVWLLGATGIRWGEATALQWRDVTDRHLTIRQAWKHGATSRELGSTKTTRSSRRVETDPAVIAALGKRGRPNELVFMNTRGARVQHSTFYPSHWEPAVTRARLSPRPTVHHLRHFAASYMLGQGADIFEVSRALGHADISTTTRIYGHLIPSRTRPTVTHAAELQAALAKRIES